MRTQAEQLRKAGKTYEAIARSLGVSTSTVYGWLNPKTGQRPRAPGDRPWKSDRPDAWDCQLANKTLLAMARK